VSAIPRRGRGLELLRGAARSDRLIPSGASPCTGALPIWLRDEEADRDRSPRPIPKRHAPTRVPKAPSGRPPTHRFGGCSSACSNPDARRTTSSACMDHLLSVWQLAVPEGTDLIKGRGQRFKSTQAHPAQKLCPHSAERPLRARTAASMAAP
jgi:hypothetical protein